MLCASTVEHRQTSNNAVAMVSAPARENLKGKRVCFTGECRCLLRGSAISRELGTQLATDQGLVVADSVTKDLDILVVADPQTQSGKAKKARQYGVRVMHEPVFWRAIGIDVE